MELETLFGLPAHPLVVHAAVVLLPLAAVATIVVALVPRARRHYAPVAFGLALAATVAVGLAQGSGEELEDRVDETALVEAHTEKGEQVLPWVVLTLLVSGAVVAAGPLQRRFGDKVKPAVVTGVLTAGALVAGIGATVTVIDVGHSGAKATWNDVQANPSGGDDYDDDDD
ncbi:MAG: hypothetical protein MUE34_10800 [Acidimicrobiales bacterium]|nr:hypothetical protein [Acidimicrobiales bacterium]